MSRIIDTHCHMLPNIDDGSSSVEMSLQMLRRSAEQGITHVIATPHFYPQYDTPEHFLQKRHDAECRLREAMEGEKGLPSLSVGAEVYFFHGISDSDMIQRLTIEEKRCILIEMPEPPWTGQMYLELEGIRTKQGLTPIVAHVDRYIRPFRTFRIPEKLSQMPVYVQANASFFLQPSTRRMAIRMLRNGDIHLLGSDAHNLKSRVPNLGEAVEVIRHHLGDDALYRISHWQNDALDILGK